MYVTNKPGFEDYSDNLKNSEEKEKPSSIIGASGIGDWHVCLLLMWIGNHCFFITVLLQNQPANSQAELDRLKKVINNQSR